MTLHWIRTTSLQDWYTEHASLLGSDDALLLTDAALAGLATAPLLTNSIYTLAAEVSEPLPDYVKPIDDAQWLELVLNYSHQLTW